MGIKRLKAALAVVLVLSFLTGCVSAGTGSLPGTGDGSANDNMMITGDETSDLTEESGSGEIAHNDAPVGLYGRPSLILKELKLEDSTVTPNVPDFEVAPDLSNVYRINNFFYRDEEKELLYKNGFVVLKYGGDEFFETYESNRYDFTPNFITVDSLMHTYHLYFSYLLKKIEKNNLSKAVEDLGKAMAENSIKQYEELKGSEWENAALRNVAFFSIGARLMDDSFEVKSYIKDIVDAELDKIYKADSITISAITGKDEDYTQYIPRGYYAGDEQLEKYFRAMMWYGRMHFRQDAEDLDRSALLITKAVVENVQCYETWSAVYAITSFFAGSSDDAGIAEYANAMYDSYRHDVSAENLINNKEAFAKFYEVTKDIKVPQINSLPIMAAAETNIIPGFMFMGQRFTIDAMVMQNLIYRAVKENASGDARMLPDVLDFPAALGSETAAEILKEQGDYDYENYPENMEKLRKDLSEDNEDLWSASLYASWLNTLRPLLNENRDGYPQFMRSKEWAKKNLECFAGSYTELKHDTVLYSKQVFAEMGGGDIDEWDDRGYVEPEPSVYIRFMNLANQTKEGLKRFEMLDKAQEEDLDRLIEIAKQLKTISEKELTDELPTDEEFDFIREYGGYIEHFWYEIAKEDKQDEYVSTQEYPAALVTDIATDPNGHVLELATDSASCICVIVKVDDKIKIARGSVYSFYQFLWPSDDRLTDQKWWKITGVDWDFDHREEYDAMMPDKPEWTKSYRYYLSYDED